MMKKHPAKVCTAIIVIFLVALLQACAPKSQEDCNFVLNSDNQRVSWSSKVVVELYLHDSFPSKYLPALKRAIKRWEDSIGRDLFEIVGYIGGKNLPQKDSYSTIYYITDWSSVDRGKQAVTGIHWLGDRIVEADIRINGQDYTYSTTNESPVPLDTVDFESLLVHELGHVLGLRHNDELVGSVMNHQLANGDVRRKISNGDKESLMCEYQ